MLSSARSRSFVFVLGAAVVAALLMALGLGGGDEIGAAGAAALAPAAAAPRLVAPNGGARLTRLLGGAQLVSADASEFSNTYQLADGSMVSRVSSTPLNFRDGRGRWRAIDNSLVARGDGFANRAGGHGVRLPRRLSRGVQVSAGSDRLSMRLAGADGALAVRGARAR